MKRILTVEAINKKIGRIQNSYKKPITSESDYNRGKFSGWIDALLYIRNTYELPKTK